MKAAAAPTALLALAVRLEQSAAFVAPCSGGFLRKGVPTRQCSTATAATMSLDNNSARVALGTFLAGAAVLFSGGEAALADGSTTKFSLPPISQGKDRCIIHTSCCMQICCHAWSRFLGCRVCVRAFMKGGGQPLMPGVGCCSFAAGACSRAVLWDRRMPPGISCTICESAT